MTADRQHGAGPHLRHERGHGDAAECFGCRSRRALHDDLGRAVDDLQSHDRRGAAAALGDAFARRESQRAEHESAVLRVLGYDQSAGGQNGGSWGR